jgi:hypothetical protein
MTYSIEFSIGDSLRNPIQNIWRWQVNWHGSTSEARLHREDQIFTCRQPFDTKGLIEIVNPKGDTMRVHSPYWDGRRLDMGLIPFAKGDFEVPYLVYAIHNWAHPHSRNNFTPNLSENWNQFRKNAPLPYQNLYLEPLELFPRGSLVKEVVPNGVNEGYLELLDLSNLDYLFGDTFRHRNTIGTTFPRTSYPETLTEKNLYVIHGKSYYFLFDNDSSGFRDIRYGELVIPVSEKLESESQEGDFQLYSQMVLEGQAIVFGNYRGIGDPTRYHGIHGLFKIHTEPIDSVQLKMLMEKFERMNPVYIKE